MTPRDDRRGAHLVKAMEYNNPKLTRMIGLTGVQAVAEGAKMTRLKQGWKVATSVEVVSIN